MVSGRWCRAGATDTQRSVLGEYRQAAVAHQRHVDRSILVDDCDDLYRKQFGMINPWTGNPYLPTVDHSIGFIWIFFKKPCFFLPLEMWVSCEFCLQPVLGLRFCQTQYANFHLRLVVWGLLKSCKNSRSTIGFTAWFMRKWGFHCGSCGLSQHMGRKSKPGHDGNSQVPKWFASHTTEI